MPLRFSTMDDIVKRLPVVSRIWRADCSCNFVIESISVVLHYPQKEKHHSSM